MTDMTKIGETIDAAFGDDIVAYTDDVDHRGVFVVGDGVCGRFPVAALAKACGGSRAKLAAFLQAGMG